MSTTRSLPQIPLSIQSTAQLQRAWCLMLVRLIWPTISAERALPIAQWLNNGQAPEVDR